MSRLTCSPIILADSVAKVAEIRFRSLTLEVALPVATITLARPESRNGIDAVMAAELREACGKIAIEDGVRLAVIAGSGDAFSVGRETPPAESESGAARLEWITRMQAASSVASLPMPVVASVNGDAIDHGLELALAADLRIAADHAVFAVTDISRGALPWDGATQRLPRLVGPAWARDMLLTSRVLDSGEAFNIGLVNRVVEAARLQDETRALADAVLAGGPIAARYAKEALVCGPELTLEQGLRLEADLNVVLQSTADRAEGIRSFLERRAPNFTGR